MKLIELTQGRVAIVDDEDFEWLSKWKWCYHRVPEDRTGYVQRWHGILMHREILKHHQLWQEGSEPDHINGCGCDNRKCNLRMATPHENKRNKKRYRNNTSSITGVSWSNRSQKWRAYISPPKKKKPQHLGWFIHKKDAVAARRAAEIKYFGEYRHDPKQLCPLWKTGQCPDCAARARELGLLG